MVAAWLTLKSGDSNAGVITGTVVSGLLAGRFIPAFLKTKAFYPGGLLGLLALVGLIVGLLASVL
jgi:uncharacterized membrane protein (UPF0136 family)